MLQTMLYLANQQSNYSLQELYNLPPGVTPAGKRIALKNSERMSHLNRLIPEYYPSKWTETHQFPLN